MEYERIHEPPLQRQSGGFSPAKLRAMLLGLEKDQHNGEDTSPEANDSGELDDRRSMECSTSTEMSSNSGHRSRNRAQDDDSFDSESSSSGPPTVKRSAAVAAFLPPFSRPTPSKWDDAEKWISSPTANRTGRVGSAAGAVPKKSALAFPEHVTRPPAVAKVVAEVPSNTGTLVKNSVALAQPNSFNPARSASIVDEPAHAVRSVSMRDMGTEMTPIASQEPSRTGTPIIASSPTSSRTPTPQRNAEISIGDFGSSKTEMSEEELQMNTRKEIMDLGQRLGKTTIAAWASKEEKSATNFANITTDKDVEIDRETRAADWEEAEKAKYLARFQREEVKIQAWENHQKAKIEAEMKRIEAKIEIRRAREQDRLSSKLAAARHKAEAKREAAEARRNQEAARTEEQAAQIRKTGHIPSSISCWCWCF
ncbi:hypothetical protein E2562_000811 [Oryza meyeriana var. granulata]|uniref:Remorin C-terminal domain-containing protein n=1 Tax=Oryza meyeriana var. granulata TaxID=110450 RepID=A0A6G1DUC7_9ORYZ|nr:hypothetical protein E2562_000811 [Oryza meyeriana var. granulata]